MHCQQTAGIYDARHVHRKRQRPVDANVKELTLAEAAEVLEYVRTGVPKADEGRVILGPPHVGPAPVEPQQRCQIAVRHDLVPPHVVADVVATGHWCGAGVPGSRNIEEEDDEPSSTRGRLLRPAGAMPEPNRRPLWSRTRGR